MRTGRAISPRCTSPIRLPSAVSRPLMPKAASVNSTSLSARVWGAWSVAMMSITLSFSPLIRALISSSVLRGGLTLALVL